MAHAKRSAVEGTIATAGSVGVKAPDAASAAATGALTAAKDIGETAVNSVSGILETTIGGVKVVAKSPFKKEEEPRAEA